MISFLTSRMTRSTSPPNVHTHTHTANASYSLFDIEIIMHHFSYHDLACRKAQCKWVFLAQCVSQCNHAAASRSQDTSHNLKRRAEHLTFPFDGLKSACFTGWLVSPLTNSILTLHTPVSPLRHEHIRILEIISMIHGMYLTIFFNRYYKYFIYRALFHTASKVNKDDTETGNRIFNHFCYTNNQEFYIVTN